MKVSHSKIGKGIGIHWILYQNPCVWGGKYPHASQYTPSAFIYLTVFSFIPPLSPLLLVTELSH